MFQRISQYPLIEAAGTWYRPRGYGNPLPDGVWEGWLVFFPVAGGAAIAPSHPETTQSTLAALEFWASSLTPVYLEGALARALVVAQHSSVSARLSDAEYLALDEAERLETAASVERTSAALDELAAEDAREAAEEIREAATSGTKRRRSKQG
jgi:hypothetical protein